MDPIAQPDGEPSGIDVVLFDLGGVLFDMGGVAVMRALTGIESDVELWRRWLECRWVRAYERGDCSTDEFAAGVVADWGLDLSAADYQASFLQWDLTPYEGAADLVGATRERVVTGCLSNTNALHARHVFLRVPFINDLDHRFFSHEIRHVKPDPEIFEHVIERLGTEPDRVLFLDDNELNVAGARAAGLQSHVARGPDEARRVLVATGVLP